MAKKKKSPEEDEIKSKTSEQQREPTLTHDHAALRLVKNTWST